MPMTKKRKLTNPNEHTDLDKLPESHDLVLTASPLLWGLPFDVLEIVRQFEVPSLSLKMTAES